MRLITFTEGNRTRIGALNGDAVVDLSVAAPDLATNMLTFLEAGESAMASARDAAGGETHFSLADVRLEAPLRSPKIIGIGLNYRAHAEESGMELPKWPLVFTKQSQSINAPFDPIYWSEDSKLLDYEGELGVVIGKTCRRVPKDKAPSVIAGFCIVNDVSVRDWQTRGTPPSFTMGKSWDTHCPLGPAITTPDEVDPHSLQLKTWVNDELRQDTNTNDLIFDSYELIEFLSTAFTLEVGTVIATGTPSGVGAAMNPRSFLTVGDVVRIEIEGLGRIENTVIEEPQGTTRF
ncbi:MAG: fumarylacetoacetate hydrolase family protein [Gammaproteobacteria bacterium]|nr:fumarylacetoacetate hydrolase family protein [Gammaproteobacteria bacterium]